jgi:hypothetical protein
VRQSASFRWLLAIAVVWLLGGFLLGLFDRALWDRLWVFVFGVWALYAAVGIGLWVFALWHARKPPRPAAAVGLGLILPLGALILWLLLPQLTRAGDAFLFTRRFTSLRAQYATLVAEVQSGATLPTTWGEQNGIRFQVDSGPPMRVAFLQPGGILDNWEGVVYDPTGRVATATGWRAGVAGITRLPPML